MAFDPSPPWTVPRAAGFLVVGALLASAPQAHTQDAPVAESSPTSPPLTSPSLPLATDCEESHLILLPDSSLDESFAREIVADLAADLSSRGISLCATSHPGVVPAAIVTLRQVEGLLVIELDDRVTHKRVQRDLSLLKVPEAGRALAAAIAVDELLRASWAELTMGKPQGVAAAPPPPSSANQDTFPREPTVTSHPRPRVGRGAVSGWLGYGHGPEAWDALLAGVNVSAWPRAWLWLQLGVFGLRTRTVETPLGTLYGRGLVVDATLGGCPWNGPRGFSCAGARGGLDWIAFEAEAKQGLAEARDLSATGAHLQGVVSLGVALGHHLLLTTEFALGGPLQQVVATDGPGRWLGTRGPMLNVGLGLGVKR